MLWAIFAAMTAAAVAAVLWPLLRRPPASAPRAAYDLEVYRDQLSEVDRDRDRGVLTEAEANAARAEIGRRAIAAAAAVPAPETAPPPTAPPPATRRWWALAIAALGPALALGLYLDAGRPGLPGHPLASRAPVADPSAELARMTDGLIDRLRQKPDDREGWIMLARAHAALDRPGESVAAWRRAIALGVALPEIGAEYGESLAREAGGTVTPEARAAFEQARTLDPFEPRAAFYLGLAQAQEGAPREAMQIWTDLIAASPPDAPWLDTVRERLRRTATSAGIDPATIKPSAEALEARARAEAQRPANAEAEALMRLPPEERAAAIRGMVERLAARMEEQPNDLEGWRRLGRAWLRLGERVKAEQALARAAALAPDNVAVLNEYGEALLGDTGPGQPLPPAFVEVMRKVLALDPANIQGLWFMGVAEEQAGNRAAALGLWEKLLAALPPSSPLSGEVRKELDRLKGAN